MSGRGRLSGRQWRLSFVTRMLILQALACGVSGGLSSWSSWRNWMSSCMRPSFDAHPSRTSSRILLGNSSNASSVSEEDPGNPCISQELKSGKPYNLGIVMASNTTFLNFTGYSRETYGDISDPVVVRHWFETNTWIIRQDSIRNDSVCNTMLMDPSYQLAFFQLLGDKQTVLKIPPSESTIQNLIDGQAAMRNGTISNCCNDIMMAYNSHGHQVPFLTRDLSLSDPSPGWFRGAVVTSQLVITSNFEPQQTPAQDVFFSEPIPVATTNTSLCKQCIRCQRWNAKEFLGPELSETVDTSQLNFQCFNGTQCAWGPGLCNACLDGLYSGNAMPEWFGRFVMTEWPDTPSSSGTPPYNSSQPMTDADKETAERRACDTVCSTYYEIWFSGIDSQGSLMLSQPSSMISIVLERPFRALAVYQFLFGISNALLDSLEAVELI